MNLGWRANHALMEGARAAVVHQMNVHIGWHVVGARKNCKKKFAAAVADANPRQ
jgi:hypothetical protein